MGYALRERQCSDCSIVITGHLPPVAEVRCITCAIKRASDAAYQMARKSGPNYDRWLRTRGPEGRPRLSIDGG